MMCTFLCGANFPPCVQGCVPGFVPLFNIPTQVCLFNSTIQLSSTSFKLHVLILIVHFSLLDCAQHWRPLCLILVCFHPCAPSKFCYYLTIDTMLFLPPSNLLVTVHVGRVQFCFNFECGGVSCSQLNFQGTRRFSVQLHPLPSL